MSITRNRAVALALPLVCAQVDAVANASQYGFGRTATEAEIAVSDLDVRFDGTGLPAGQGTAAEGAKTYQTACASCHGAELEGNEDLWVKPLLSDTRHGVNNLPFAPPLFAYIRRSMPLYQPGSLSDDEVYGLVAFLLKEAGIWKSDDIALDAAGLSAIDMPNRQSFVPAPASGVKAPEAPR